MTKEFYFTKEYLDKIYYFCLKKTGNTVDAEDLAAEISVEIAAAFGSGALIENPEAYVWTVARNRYARWADKKRRRSEMEICDPDDLTEVPSGTESAEETVVLRETINELRRELALIEKEYREILVAYYIRQKKISEIAQTLSIPEGSVKTKLYKGRMRLKGGMEMAREFGKRSYAPEEIYISQSGGKSWNNEPDRFLWDDLNSRICKNILIQAYNNPSTLEMLSLELGIAMPYLEPFVEQMTEATLMLKSKTNPQTAVYETNFVIISGEAVRKMVDKLASVQEEFVKNATAYLTRARELQLAGGVSILGDFQDYEEQKWTLALRLADDIQWSVYDKRDLAFSYDTKRPNGGSWDVMGSQAYEGKRFYFVGHSVGRGSSLEVNMFVTNRQANSDEDKTLLLGKHVIDIWDEMIKKGCLKLKEREVQQLGASVRKRDDGKYEIAFGVYKKEHNSGGMRYGIATELYNEEQLPIWQRMEKLAWEYVVYCEGVMRGEVPKKLKSQFNFCMHSIPFLRGMLVEGLLDNGFLKPEEELSDMIGVYTTV